MEVGERRAGMKCNVFEKNSQRLPAVLEWRRWPRLHLNRGVLQGTRAWIPKTVRSCIHAHLRITHAQKWRGNGAAIHDPPCIPGFAAGIAGTDGPSGGTEAEHERQRRPERQLASNPCGAFAGVASGRSAPRLDHPWARENQETRLCKGCAHGLERRGVEQVRQRDRVFHRQGRE